MILQTIKGSTHTFAFSQTMPLTRVLLSIEQQLHAQLLKNALLARGDIELVGESKGVVDSLMLIAAKKPDLWIHSWGEEAERSAAFSHAYSLVPDLAVVRISPDEPTGFLYRPVNSISEMVDLACRSRPAHRHSAFETAGGSP